MIRPKSKTRTSYALKTCSVDSLRRFLAELDGDASVVFRDGIANTEKTLGINLFAIGDQDGQAVVILANEPSPDESLGFQ